MMLGSHVSALSTHSSTAAAHGLSFVVAVYNAAAGLALFHEQLCSAAALRQLQERNRFFKGLASWIGFRQIRVDYEPAARAHGITSFSPARLIGLSIEGLTSFSVAPLRFASLLGLLLAFGAFIFGLQILIETFVFGQSVPGYPSLVVGLMVLGGVQLIMIGIMGEYIGKILSELKARPVYFVAEHMLKTAEDAGRAAGDPPQRSAAE